MNNKKILDDKLQGLSNITRLMYYADITGLKGKTRKWFGWILIICSDIAFAAVTVFSMKRLFVQEINQQELVNWTFLLTDIGLAAILVILAVLLLWRLFDLFKGDGIWKKEMSDPELDVSKTIETEVAK